jgi:hypothetical protein
MMLHVDAGGHFSWENAHVLPDASHVHTAACSGLDGAPLQTQSNGTAQAAGHAQPDLPLPFATTAAAALATLPGAAGMGKLSGLGTPARAELTCLTAIILLV